MKALTVRNVPQDLAEALEREKRRRGESLNKTVLQLLAQGLGVGHSRSNGLAELGGRWSEQEFCEFEDAVAFFDDPDDEVWR
jgi:plasmid stability protein